MAGSKNDVVVGKNADFSQAGAPNATTAEANGLATNGQLWVGTTALNVGGTHINVGALTSPDSSVTIGYSSPNITLVAGGAVPLSFNGNSGTAVPSSNLLNVVTTNATVKFVGSGSTLTQNFGITNLLLGSSGASIGVGTSNVSLGNGSLNALNAASRNTIIGSGSGVLIANSSDNHVLGALSLTSLTGGQGNIVVGSSSLINLLTGAFNTIIGVNQGNGYSGLESSNILLGGAAVTGESNVIRIGSQGTGNQLQNRCFIAGIVGITTSNNQMVSIDSTTGQLGVIAATTLKWSVITIDQTAAVNNGYICNKGSALLLTLPATAVVGDIIRVTGINTALGWKIVQNANQQIFFGTSSTTLGVTGFLQSAAIRDSVELICVVAGASTVYNVISSVGNITIS